MPIHFAAARSASHSPVARALARRAVRRAANDNGCGLADVTTTGERHLLHAALRHFAEHGLRAAEEAAAQARTAWRDGEVEACRWWTGVCYKLNRPLARELSIQTGITPAPAA